MKKFICVFVVVMLSLPLVWPLLNTSYFPMHDDTQVGRVVAMGKALRLGQFPVRWVSDLGYGYGYPIFNFYGPLPYYVGGFLYALGFSGLVATKFMMASGIILAGVTMFLFATSILGAMSGIVVGLLYAYAPYHAVQLYVRGSVGELWAFVFLPLLVWGIFKSRKLIGGIGLAGIIVSHTLLGYATVVILIVMVGFIALIRNRDPHHFTAFIKSCISLVGIGLGMTAFFWIPAIFEMRFTGVSSQIGQTADFRDHFVCLAQLWSSPWGFGGSAKGCIDGMSFMIGKLHVVGGIMGFTLLLIGRRSFRKRWLKVWIYGVVVACTGVLFVLPASQFIWEITPGFAYLQYPWRFLVYVIFGMSILTGIFLQIFSNKYIRYFISCMFILVILTVYGKKFQPQYLYSRDASEFETMYELRMRISKISDEYLSPDFIRPEKDTEYVYDTISSTDSMRVATILETDTYSKYSIVANQDEVTEVKKMYFPGTTILINGKHANPQVQNSIPTILIPKGENIVEIRFDNTPIRIIGNIISLIVTFGLLLYYGKNIKS